jgi:hypothetical protein
MARDYDHMELQTIGGDGSKRLLELRPPVLQPRRYAPLSPPLMNKSLNTSARTVDPPPTSEIVLPFAFTG